MLAACAGSARLPASYVSGSGSSTSSNPSGLSAPSAQTFVSVRRGDTVYAISRRYGVPVRDIIDANRLAPPYELRIGQRLFVPAPKLHVVAKGDTVYGISRRYGTDVAEMVRLNDIASPYTIKVGQALRIPTGQGEAAGTQTASLPPTPEAAPSEPTVVPDPPPRSGDFRWPLKGKLLSRFGPKKGGLHNDGVNIAAPRGTEVRAAENGVVAYAGNEIRGFGNLVLIKHDQGWMTAYAHNDRLMVRRGDRVQQGQVIANVGSSGNVASPQLHFELRKGRRAVDPLKHMGPVQTAALAQ